jgi:hypothetical protein
MAQPVRKVPLELMAQPVRKVPLELMAQPVRKVPLELMALMERVPTRLPSILVLSVPKKNGLHR